MNVKQNDMSAQVSQSLITRFETFLSQEERSANTIAKYVRDLRTFFDFLNGRKVNKGVVLEWKEWLTDNYAPASVNSMLAAVNGFLVWAGFPQMKVKPLKLQRDLFSKPERELTIKEYTQLVNAARRKGNERLSLLLQTICATGIRVSELQFITVEAVKAGRVEVNCKGKRRMVFLPNDLRLLLKKYMKNEKRTVGPVFVTKGGKQINRSNIWRDMKALCQSAGVEPGKVFPHNLRHLFARRYYTLEKDLSRLADILGHSSVNTTRIYTAESGTVHAQQVGRLGLVIT